MDAKTAFQELFASDGKPDALRLTINRGDDLSMDLHSDGNITLWWKGAPVEFVPLITKMSAASLLGDL